MMELKANLVDIKGRRIFPARVTIADGIIIAIGETDEPVRGYMIPGFIDAHVHIESSLLIPSEFARMAVIHGTVATVSDPHEIANVVGLHGVDFMIENGNKVPFRFFFGAPSCVPATVFETAGAVLDAKDVDDLLQRDEILYLSEMMNFPGVLHKDPEVMAKLASAKKYNKPVDGHAPGLRGDAIRQYISEGISTDHECYRIDEAREKLALGMKVIIREGSAARNFEELIPLLDEHAENLMFCSDDKHPDSLISGHINQLVARAVAKGNDLFKVLQVACINPVTHYRLPVGQLRVNDPADLVILNDLENFTVMQTFVKGELVAENGGTKIKSVKSLAVNHFAITAKEVKDFSYRAKEKEYVIGCLDGQLITEKLEMPGVQCTAANDVLKMAVVNRYTDAPVAVSFIKNFGLRSGAIAGSVAHDSHNIVAVGVDDESICRAVNLVIAHQGGLCAVDGDEAKILPLPVAGLMSDGDAWEVERSYSDLDRMAKRMGSGLRAPFMSLSFMALLVIPHLKLSDKGLFDGDTFSFVNK